MGEGRHPSGAHKPGPVGPPIGPDARHLGNNPFRSELEGRGPLCAGAAAAARSPPWVPGADLTRGLGWGETHVEQAAALKRLQLESRISFSFFLFLKEKDA